MKMVPNKLSINQPKMQNGFSEEKIRRLYEAYQMSCNFVDGMIFIGLDTVRHVKDVRNSVKGFTDRM